MARTPFLGVILTFQTYATLSRYQLIQDNLKLSDNLIS